LGLAFSDTTSPDETCQIRKIRQPIAPLRSSVESFSPSDLKAVDLGTTKKHKMTNKPKAGQGMAIGIIIGTLIGVLTENIAIWLAIGTALGAGLSHRMGQKEKGVDQDQQ
jgi:hypothetical protein